eukprot:928507-Rhodomonas_salina.2
MSGTGIAYGTDRDNMPGTDRAYGTDREHAAVCLHDPYNMSGTDVAYAVIPLVVRYAMSGTYIPYGSMRCPVLAYHMALSLLRAYSYYDHSLPVHFVLHFVLSSLLFRHFRGGAAAVRSNGFRVQNVPEMCFIAFDFAGRGGVSCLVFDHRASSENCCGHGKG